MTGSAGRLRCAALPMHGAGLFRQQFRQLLFRTSRCIHDITASICPGSSRLAGDADCVPCGCRSGRIGLFGTMPSRFCTSGSRPSLSLAQLPSSNSFHDQWLRLRPCVAVHGMLRAPLSQGKRLSSVEEHAETTSQGRLVLTVLVTASLTRECSHDRRIPSTEGGSDRAELENGLPWP